MHSMRESRPDFEGSSASISVDVNGRGPSMVRESAGSGAGYAPMMGSVAGS